MFLCGRSRYRRFARLVLGTSFALWLLVWALQHSGDYTGQFMRSQERSMAKMDIGELNEKAANSKENARVREKEEVSEMKAEVVFLTDEAAAIKEEPVKEEVKEELLIKEETIAKKKEIPARKEETASVHKKASAQNKDLLSKQVEPRPVQMEASDEKNEVSAKKEAAPSKQVQGKEGEATEKKQDAPSKKVSPEANGVPTKKEATAKKNELAENKDEAAAKNDEPQGKKEESLTMKEKVPAKKEGVPTSTQNVPFTTSTPFMTIIPPEINSSYIGDTYFQEDKRLHTTDCPSSIMKKMVGSDFQSIYLEKLPLLQWAPHATLEEYTRLRRYNGCFGWDVISWDYLKQTLSLLNTSANGYMFSDWNWKPKAGSPCIRCAVVGNGGILNGSKKGKEIDEHDYVFRVNGAILDDYVEDVGNRTSFYFFSVNTMMNSLYNYEIDGFQRIPQSKKVNYVFIPDNDRDYYMVKAALTGRHVDQGEENGTLPSTLFGESYTTEQFKIMHPDFMRYLRNRFLLSSTLGTTMRDIYRPSSGAIMLLTGIHSCDEVSAYGFITPDYEKYSNHYYDKTKKEVFFYLNHDYQIEMQLWQTMHKQGVIKLYTRS